MRWKGRRVLIPSQGVYQGTSRRDEVVRNPTRHWPMRPLSVLVPDRAHPGWIIRAGLDNPQFPPHSRQMGIQRCAVSHAIIAY